jgi:Fe2+ or Zn2+ uptake regulation protein
LRVLEQEGHPLTNKEIFHRLPTGQCDLATVYRAVQLLERLGLVKRFLFGTGAARLRY